MIKEILFTMHILVANDVTLSTKAIDIAKDLRKVTDSKLVITSNCREVAYNRSIGGKTNSKHLTCDAIDLRSRTLDAATIEDIEELHNLGYDVVIEHDHIHIEVE